MVVSDKIEIQQALASALGLCGLAPIIAKTESEAIAILSHHSIALIFCSDELPGDPINALIRGARRFLNQVPVVVVSRLDDWERYLNCLRSGAFDYALYPLARNQVERIVNSALWQMPLPALPHVKRLSNVLQFGQTRRRES